MENVAGLFHNFQTIKSQLSCTKNVLKKSFVSLTVFCTFLKIFPYPKFHFPLSNPFLQDPAQDPLTL